MEMDFWEIFAWAEGLVLLALLIARFWRRT